MSEVGGLDADPPATPPGPLAAGDDLAGVPEVSRDAALSKTAWSPEIVAQSLEVLFLCLRDGEVRLLRPVHADAVRLGWRPDFEANDIVLAAARRYGLEPILSHSTSWRFENGAVVLTYVAAVAPPTTLSTYRTDEPVARVDLARGSAFEAPPEIGVAQVVEHACRHLAWLIHDDEAVASAIPEWASYLSGFTPEPFRAFGTPG
jgi:hypothetical protein